MFQVHLYIRELNIYIGLLGQLLFGRQPRKVIVTLSLVSSLYRSDVWLCSAQGAVISARVEQWYNWA